MAKLGTERVLEYARLAMGSANVRASRYGMDSLMFGRVLLVLVQGRWRAGQGELDQLPHGAGAAAPRPVQY